MPKIPEKVLSVIRRIHGYAISDSGIFLILAHMFIVKSFSYYPEGLQEYYIHPFEVRLDNDVFFYLWFIIGLLLLSAAFYRNTLYMAFVFSGSMTFVFLWGLSFVLTGRIFVAQLGLIYITLALIVTISVYRGRRSEYRLTKEK